MKKKWLLMVLVGIILGLVIVTVESKIEIPNVDMINTVLIIGIAVLFVAMLINLMYNVTLSKKVKVIGYLLSEEDRIDEFIVENEKLLKTAKGRFIRSLISLNLSAGYSRKKEYDKARIVLEAISSKDLKGINRAIYYINLSYIYFKLNKVIDALTLMEEAKKDLKEVENSRELGGNIAVINAWAEIKRGNKKEAKTMIENAMEVWTSKELKEDFEYLLTLI